MLTGKEKAVAALVITTIIGLCTGLSQVLADGTTKNVLLVVGLVVTALGTTLGVYQTTNTTPPGD